MTPESTAKTLRPGLSLYANLLDSGSAETPAPGTISQAPIAFKQFDGRAEGNDSEVSAQRQQSNAGTYEESLMLQS